MVSKSEIKLLRNLSKKKFREKHGLYLIEGKKLLSEALTNQAVVRKVFYTASEDAFIETLNVGANTETISIGTSEMAEMTNQVTPPGLLATLEIPNTEWHDSQANEGPLLMLDGLRDPGNLGTVLRSADWFGVTTILCSKDCVDAYNPKVVQSSMGSIFRVRVLYVDLPETITAIRVEAPAFTVSGAALEGELLGFGKEWSTGALVIGSESHGMSPEVRAECNQLVRIPGGKGTESLNAAVAASILMYQWLSPRN